MHLDLSFNAITSIEDNNFINLRNLQQLKLDNNKLITIPMTLDRIVTLKELDISKNAIKTLDFLEHVSERLPNLKRIVICDNAWQCTHLRTFREHLYASRNTIIVRRPAEDCDHIFEHIPGVGCDMEIEVKLPPNETQSPVTDTAGWTASIISNGFMGLIIIVLVISILLLYKRYRRALNELHYETVIYNTAKTDNIYEIPI